MNQRDLAGRFSSDVDHLLNEASLSDPGLNSNDYDELLKLAQQLAVTEMFSKPLPHFWPPPSTIAPRSRAR